MNWEAISAISEVVGALVVVISVISVISVIYLATQISQNTSTIRAEATRTFSIEVARQYSEWGQDVRVSTLWYRLIYEQVRRSELTPEEAMSASFLIISRLSLYDTAYRSFKEGILNEEEFHLLKLSGGANGT